MNLNPYELVLIAGGFTVIGALLGGWIGYRNAIGIYNIAEFNKASSTFRNVFLPETTYLKHNANIGGLGSSNNLHEILFSGYLRQLKALEIFKIYLSRKDREGIEKAWQNYCKSQSDHTVLNFEQYSTKNANREREKELKQLAYARINEILKFAKHKSHNQ